MSKKSKSKSSSRWLDEHHSDEYVQKARDAGYRSRASFKLIELDQKDRLMTPGMTVLDLGAAPGGWSQVAVQKVGSSGQVIASDILGIDAIAEVEFLQGDFTEEAVYDELMRLLNGRNVDLVISDMAPNMSGMPDIDQPKSMHLVELALDMARTVLVKNGCFVAKVFQGEGFDAFLADIKTSFSSCVIRKPKASRPRSKEVYLVAKGYS